jgi:hypothetical protein
MSLPFLASWYGHPETVQCSGRALVLLLFLKLPWRRGWMHLDKFICLRVETDPPAAIYVASGRICLYVCHHAGAPRLMCLSARLSPVSFSYFQFVFPLLERTPPAMSGVQFVLFPFLYVSSVQCLNINSVSIKHRLALPEKLNRIRSRNTDYTGYMTKELGSIPGRGNWFFSSQQLPGSGVNSSRCKVDHSSISIADVKFARS